MKGGDGRGVVRVSLDDCVRDMFNVPLNCSLKRGLIKDRRDSRGGKSFNPYDISDGDRFPTVTSSGLFSSEKLTQSYSIRDTPLPT